MASKGKKKKNSKKVKQHKSHLFSLLLLLLLTALSLSFTSYAWFTTNRLVKVDLLDVSVRAQGGIEISTDGETWKGTVTLDDIKNARLKYPGSVNQLPKTLEQVSTAGEIENGKIKMFSGAAVNDFVGNYILSTERSIETESFEDGEGKFIAFDLFLKTNMPAKLYLTPESTITYGGDTSVGIENAVRVAFVNEGTVSVGSSLASIQGLTTNSNSDVHIWEPNYNSHTVYGIENARNVYGIETYDGGERILYDGVSNVIGRSMKITPENANSSKYPGYFKRVNVEYYTVNNFRENVMLFDIRNGITKYRVYMWIEGQDVDCENNASVGNISLNLQFSTNPS